MKLTEQETILFHSWRQVFMKSMSTFWILFSLQKKSSQVEEMESCMSKYSQASFDMDRKSLYRALRKLYEGGIVSYTEKTNPYGPNWKVYYITERGERLFQAFVEQCLKHSLLNPLVMEELQLS